jgi:hypothetical protein
MAIHFLIAKYLQKDSNLASASQISECWRLTNGQYFHSSRFIVHAIRAMMPQDMAGRTDDDFIETLYYEDDALSDFLATFMWSQKTSGFAFPSTKTS